MYFYRKNSIIFIKLISIGRQFHLNKIAINKTREVKRFSLNKNEIVAGYIDLISSRRTLLCTKIEF